MLSQTKTFKRMIYINADLIKINVKDFRGLKVWQKARDLINCIYNVTENYPKFETYIIKS